MIISRGRRYIFVHIPKTGGTALSLALEARAMKDDILIGDTPKARKRRNRLKALQPAGRLWKHSRLTDIDGIVDEGDVQDFFIFTLVRNPWDRMVSYYHWLKAQKFDHPAIEIAKAHGFSDFLHHDHTKASLAAASYLDHVTDTKGNARCDLFIRLEHLAEDIAPLEAHLGFSLGEIPRANATQRNRDYAVYYSGDDSQLVAELCAKDIARFGYRFAS
ncbi:sulfotransferase family 2 domain-containing protein [Pseudogemmobacter sp. W21_MBD1_M6]|uniref:sulfotransferase family 2 domain-containing protein n=1 Tax=Pseudogemmobacter sp. W21_MBD1_M6 TaxID=3240271 RepID=UPI003F986C04